MPDTSKYTSCPLADEDKTTGIPHIEGRFSALETEVGGLKHGLEEMQRSVAEGFRNVFAKIDAIGTTRQAATLPWIATFLVVAGMAAKMIYSDMSSQANVIRDIREQLQTELKSSIDRVQESVQAVAGQIGVQSQLTKTAGEAAFVKQEDYIRWRQEYVERNAYLQGQQDSKIAALEKAAVLNEERQYINTGAIGKMQQKP